MKIEEKGFRFGALAVRKGFVTVDQVIKALEVQIKENLSMDEHRLIGQILVDDGLITPAQRDEVLETLAVLPKNIFSD